MGGKQLEAGVALVTCGAAGVTTTGCVIPTSLQSMLGDKLDTVLITASAYQPNTASRHARRALLCSAALGRAAPNSWLLAAGWLACKAARTSSLPNRW